MKIITVVNNGYVPFALNWAVSAKRSGIPFEDLLVYCTDTKAQERLQATNVPAVLFGDGRFPTEGGYNHSLIWKMISWSRLDAITLELKRGEPVLCIDPDTVFHKDPRAYLNGITGVDLIAQAHVQPGHFYMCGGLLCVFPTDKGRKLVEPQWEKFDRFIHEEKMMNEALKADPSIRWLALPVNYFPDGSYRPNGHLVWDTKDPVRYITHFNCIFGLHKYAAMVTAGAWYVKERPELSK